MLVLADDRPSTRQAIAAGRASERITGRGLTGVSATLWFSTDGAAFLPLPARFRLGGEGYFTFSLMPGCGSPDLSGFPQVVLRGAFQRPGAAPVIAEVSVPGADLAVAEVEHDLHGQTVRIQRIMEAPFDLSVAVDPSPVALAGIVLRDHDPASPAADVTVTAGPVSTVTDTGGRFFVPALPLQSDVDIDLADGPTTTSHALHIDYDMPVNRVSFSLPT